MKKIYTILIIALLIGLTSAMIFIVTSKGKMPPNHLQHANEDLDKATKAAAIDAAEWEQLKKSLKKIKQP